MGDDDQIDHVVVRIGEWGSEKRWQLVERSCTSAVVEGVQDRNLRGLER